MDEAEFLDHRVREIVDSSNSRAFIVLDFESLEALQIHQHSYDGGGEYDPLDEVSSIRIRDVFLRLGYQVWGIKNQKRVEI